MPSATTITGEIASASMALAGLLLVFIGALSTSYDSYQKTEQNAVRSRFQKRAWFAFIGFTLSLLSGALALVGKWLVIECAAIAAISLFGVAIIWVLFAGLFAVREIK